ncbi:MAG: tetratricopeptide repeat protein [Candidatus Thorarchaeota archaeon]
MEVPPEFIHLKGSTQIPWDEIFSGIKAKMSEGQNLFAAFTDVSIDAATKECMKENPRPDIIALGLQSCLTRGRMAEALFLSTGLTSIEVLSLRSIVLFALSDAEGLREALKQMEEGVTEDSPPSDKVRLSTVRVLLAAAERDTSVVVAVMEFDNLLETYPEQVEEPLTETMFTLYVVGDLLRVVGQAARASRINDTLQDMALKGNHRMFLALSENLRGNICNLSGECQDAEKHYLRVKEISEILSFNLGLGMAYNNLGTLRHNSLNLEEALEFYKKAYDIMDMDAAKTAPLANLGEIAFTLGRYDEAHKYLNEAIRIEEKTQFGTIEVYAWYVILLARTGQEKEARKYLKITRDKVTESEKPLHKAAYQVAKGAVEAANKKWKLAVKSYEEALRIGRENNLFEILVRSELNLAQTHMQSYQDEGAEEEVSQAIYHLDDLIQIAKEQGLQHLYAEALLLRSDVLRLAGKKLEAKGDAERAKSVAAYVEDSRLLAQAENRLNLIAGKQVVPAPSPDLSKKMQRVAAFKPAGQLRQVPRPALYILLTLCKESGLSEFVHQFDSEMEMDSGLVSGFISAITTFSNEVMGKIGMLRSINHEGFTLMMEHTERRIVTLIAEEESFDIRYLLREFAKAFEDIYPSITLEGIKDDTFDKAEELVDTIFNSSIGDLS